MHIIKYLSLPVLTHAPIKEPLGTHTSRLDPLCVALGVQLIRPRTVWLLL